MKKIIFYITIGVITIIHLIIRLISTPQQFLQQDKFDELYYNFINNGYYVTVSKGTSPLYGMFLFGLSRLGIGYESSFILINIISQLLIILIGNIIIWKFKIENKSINYFISILFTYWIIESHLYMYGFNDMLLGVIISLVIYLVIFDHTRLVFIKLFVLFAIAISIRETGVFLVFFILYKYYLLKDQSYGFKIKFLIPLISCISLIFLIHFPSIKENKKLSFHSKEPNEFKSTWFQRNTLGLKKMLDGKTKSFDNNSIWRETKFEEVDQYLKLNGDNSLPRNIFSLIFNYPKVFFFIGIYNIIYIILWLVRFSGILLMYSIIDKKKLDNTPLVLLFIISLVLCFVSGSFIEVRWLTGYQILIFIPFIYSIKHSFYNQNKIQKYVMISIVIISLFNIKTIYTSLHNLI